MPYKFLNFPADPPPYDDVIEDALNAEERNGWRVVDVHYYEGGHVKILLERKG